jgi:hypothetical protein
MDDTETPPLPKLDPAAFDRLKTALAKSGPTAAIDDLIAELRRAEDFSGLFYALLLKKRVELGVSPFPTGPASELPPHTHEPYEQTIREAGRHVGNIYLQRGELPRAWTFFRMLGEPGPVKDALAKLDPKPDDDIYPLVEIAWQNGVLPEKGFDLVLDRHGICSAITMVGGSDLSSNAALRDYCVGRLVRALHEQVVERLRNDLAARGVTVPEVASIPRLVEGHPELFGEDAYHIDTSHLSSVVQMSTHLPPGPELDLARELCEYGRHLSPGLQGNNDPPFEENYTDFLAFLDVVAGIDTDRNLERFRAKAERDFAEGITYSAQVYVNLLVRANRLKDALAAAKRYLLREDERNLICPGVSDLARRLGDYGSLADAAMARSDAVQFLAGLIAGWGVHPPVPAE